MSSSLQSGTRSQQLRLDPPPLHGYESRRALFYTADGRQIIDAISSLWVNLHRPRESPDRRRHRRTGRSSTSHSAGFTHDAAEELVTRLRNGVPRELTHAFFSDDGSTGAVGLKLVRAAFPESIAHRKREICRAEHGYHATRPVDVGLGDESRIQPTVPVDAVIRCIGFTPAYCYRCPRPA